jgi:hypothetical protein
MWQWLMPIILVLGRLRMEASPGKWLLRPYFQNNQSKKDWRCGSTGKAPALHVQSPEFKLQSQKKKKRKRYNDIF